MENTNFVKEFLEQVEFDYKRGLISKDIYEVIKKKYDMVN